MVTHLGFPLATNLHWQNFVRVALVGVGCDSKAGHPRFATSTTPINVWIFGIFDQMESAHGQVLCSIFLQTLLSTLDSIVSPRGQTNSLLKVFMKA